jgi:nicotinamidase-related amidase
METLIVIDVQNEFSEKGKRPVPNFQSAVQVISKRVEQARSENRPIAWVRHFNKLNESKAFLPGTWGAEFNSGFGVNPGRSLEVEFQKNVYGAFTGTEVGNWLKKIGSDTIMIVGFYTHACVSTTAREAIMRELGVSIDSDGTGACDMDHELLGRLTADEVRRSALLQLANMGAIITSK